MRNSPRALAHLALGTLLASTAALAVPLGAASAAVVDGAPVPPGGVALTWSPTYMSNNHAYTRSEAESMARRFDLVAAMPTSFTEHAAAMRNANADLTLLSYSNATLAQPADVSHLSEAAYAHDSAGNRIKAPDFGTYLMESSHTGWRQTANRQCDERAARSSYDGCLVDMLTLGIFARGYVTGIPVVPGTRTAYTQGQYRDEMIRLGRVYRNNSPELAHIGNAVENSYRYWQAPVSSRPIASSLPGAQMEDFIRGAGNAVTDFPDVAEWIRNVDVVRDFESRDDTGLFTTKLWVSASDAQVAQWQGYSMATFLMGADGHSYLAFTRSRDKAGASGTNLPYVMPKQIGLPTGAMRKDESGAYLRPFANGMSLVNPTDSWVTVSLGGSYRTLNGRTVSSLTLPPNSGDVLVKSTPTTPDPTPTTDRTAPSGTHETQTGNLSSLTLTGTASDNVAVSEVSVAIRNESTMKWRRLDGSWGAYQLLPASVLASGSPFATWTARFSLPAGRYGVSLVVDDSSGNRNVEQPWTVGTVTTY